VALKIGNLIRWVSAHRSYEADGDILVGLEPIYKYGVVLKASAKSSTHFVVVSFDDACWHLLDLHYDDVEIISEGSHG